MFEEFSCDLEKADDSPSEFIEYNKIISRGGDKNVLQVVPVQNSSANYFRFYFLIYLDDKK